MVPEGAVAKLQERRRNIEVCQVTDEFAAIKGIKEEVRKSYRNQMFWPKGAPGMPEMLKPTGAVMGAGLGKDVALITDGRFSGGSHGFVVGHITPEAKRRTSGTVQNGI